MSLDTDQKRGSALDLSSPWRQWLAEPTASLTQADLLSLLRYCSEPPPTEEAGGVGLIGPGLVGRNPLISGGRLLA